jgi:glucose-6-phosphate dehydrogenase assembly protein OpcA
MPSTLTTAEPIPFNDVEKRLGGDRDQQRASGTRARALTATVVVVGPQTRVEEASTAIEQLGESGAIRGILIPHDSSADAAARVAGNTVFLTGLKRPFVDNAVAALRLSSLPTVLWWRGGPTDTLDDLVKLADRVVLDTDPPEPAWRCAVDLLDRAAFSDVRWSRLTRWRALMAQFFDIDEVRAAGRSFRTLRIVGRDRAMAALFKAWIETSLELKLEAPDFGASGTDVPIESICLSNGSLQLQLSLAGSRRCVETAVQMTGHKDTTRVVSLGDETLTSLLLDELRIRARDEAFERALRAIATQA